ncbi:MAG: hypothetical protein JKX76_02440 [Colwellia sp.]|nr:hypothetical protein [Colwellia sp.]
MDLLKFHNCILHQKLTIEFVTASLETNHIWFVNHNFNCISHLLHDQSITSIVKSDFRLKLIKLLKTFIFSITKYGNINLVKYVFDNKHLLYHITLFKFRDLPFLEETDTPGESLLIPVQIPQSQLSQPDHTNIGNHRSIKNDEIEFLHIITNQDMNDVIINSLIEYGNINLFVEYFLYVEKQGYLQQEIIFSKNQADIACKFGSMDFLNIISSSRVSETIAKSNAVNYYIETVPEWPSLDVISSVDSLGPEIQIRLNMFKRMTFVKPDRKSLSDSIKNGLLEVLVWASQLNPPIFPYKKCMEIACQYNHMNILRWGVSLPEPIIPFREGMLLACKYGHLNVLKYGMSIPPNKGGPILIPNCMDLACAGGYEHILNWRNEQMKEKGLRFWGHTMDIGFRCASVAASGGHDNVLDWIDENNDLLLSEEKQRRNPHNKSNYNRQDKKILYNGAMGNHISILDYCARQGIFLNTVQMYKITSLWISNLENLKLCVDGLQNDSSISISNNRFSFLFSQISSDRPYSCYTDDIKKIQLEYKQSIINSLDWYLNNGPLTGTEIINKNVTDGDSKTVDVFKFKILNLNTLFQLAKFDFPEILDWVENVKIPNEDFSIMLRDRDICRPFNGLTWRQCACSKDMLDIIVNSKKIYDPIGCRISGDISGNQIIHVKEFKRLNTSGLCSNDLDIVSSIKILDYYADNGMYPTSVFMDWAVIMNRLDLLHWGFRTETNKFNNIFKPRPLNKVQLLPSQFKISFAHYKGFTEVVEWAKKIPEEHGGPIIPDSQRLINWAYLNNKQKILMWGSEQSPKVIPDLL